MQTIYLDISNKGVIDGNVYSPDAYPGGWEVYNGGDSVD